MPTRPAAAVLVLAAALTGCGGGGSAKTGGDAAGRDFNNQCMTVEPSAGITMSLGDYNRLNDGEWAELIKTSSGGMVDGKYSTFDDWLKAVHPEAMHYTPPAWCAEVEKKIGE